MKTGRKGKNKGFTLVEIIVVVSIFVVLLGIMVPSLNSILGFRVQRTTHSIAAALDKTKREAMNRLVGEMKLERRADGYYISYYLDRGKVGGSTSSGNDRVKNEQAEKIAPGNISIEVVTSDNAVKKMEENSFLILTYNRDNGSFRPMQTDVMTQTEINKFLDEKRDIEFKDYPPLTDGSNIYCKEIKISGGFRTRIISLNQATGSYTITAGK